jgi:hypothetical protein
MWIRRLSELLVAGAVVLLAADARALPAAPSPDEGLADYRERFQQGMDLYKRGSAREAIAVWEPIYGDLGEQRGYRLAYDLGVAYAALDDGVHSANRLQAFLSEVDSRRGRGESLGAAVTKEESVVAVSGGVTIAAVVAAVALELHASSLHDQYTSDLARSPTGTLAPADRSSFATARTWAYVAVAGAAGFAAITVGLTGWYLFGKPHADGGSKPVATLPMGVGVGVGVGLGVGGATLDAQF